MDFDEGLFEFAPAMPEPTQAPAPASTAEIKPKHESVLPLLGEEFEPVSEEANQRLANAAAEALRIIASEK